MKMRYFLILFIIFGVSDCSDDVDFNDWIITEYELFPVLPIAAPFSQDKKCRKDSRNLIINLKNKTYWAMKSEYFFFQICLL